MNNIIMISIEEKAKAYDEAIKRVNDLISRCKTNRDRRTMIYRVDDIESIFPELKGSEDEKIRKEIIQFLQLPHPQFVGNRNYEKWIDYLENQGEQKPAEWSEEDEKMIQDIINDIAIAQEQVYCKSRCEDEINWLKSLKERYTWKPSNEQMKALEFVIKSLDNMLRAIGHIDNVTKPRLEEILVALKKLK